MHLSSTPNFYKALPLLLLMVVLWGCAASRPKAEPATAAAPIKEQTWLLTEVQGREVAPGSREVTIVFNPEAGTLGGQADCNRYYATYTLRGTVATIRDIGTMRMACPEADMNAEQRYLGLLGRTTRIVHQGNTLIFYQKERVILKFGLQ